MLIAQASRGAPEGATGRVGDYISLVANGDRGVVDAYQHIYSVHADEICAYIHDDVTVHDADWQDRIHAEFADPKVAIVGMGGALGIGLPEIYKRPYNIWQLQRIDYYSNQTDWAIHGKYETGSRDVAVVDGFFMAVRRSFLDEIGGWAWFPFSFHCYDTCLCLMARRHGWKVRMVGVSVTHHGGKTSTTPEYLEWCKSRGTTAEREHEEPHRWMYDTFRDCLPCRV